VSSPAALPVAVRWILVGSAAVWVLLELRRSHSQRPEAVRAGWRGEVAFRIVVVVGIILATLLSHAVPAAKIHPAGVAAWVGLVFFLCGIALRQWSFRTLGRYFTYFVQTSADQPVIATGPYRLVRHPSYTGLLLIFVALGLFIGNWAALAAVTVAATAALVFRVRVEERALLDTLGDAYRDYAATRERLIPFIW
jgi:protein-S-isoprenylcysteine O-methyltransferase Ste14